MADGGEWRLRRTPSAGNQQAWDIVVCTEREQLARLARVGPAAGHVAGSAATIALVAPVSDDARTRELIQYDLGQATMSIMSWCRTEATMTACSSSARPAVDRGGARVG